MSKTPNSVEGLYDFLNPNGGYAALERMMRPSGPALDEAGASAPREACNLARAMLATPEGAAFTAWLKSQICDPPSYHPCGLDGRARSMESIAAEGLYRDGQKHVVWLIFQLAQMADDHDDAEEKDA